MKSKLDEQRRNIIECLDAGVPKTRIAKNLGVNPASLHEWIKTRGVLGLSEKHPLFEESVTIIADAIVGMRDGLYAKCSRQIERLEREGRWDGNVHHAAQRIVEKIMNQIEGPLANAIRREVLR